MENEEGVSRIALLHQLMPWADINGLHSGGKLEQQLILKPLQANQSITECVGRSLSQSLQACSQTLPSSGPAPRHMRFETANIPKHFRKISCTHMFFVV